MRRGTCAFFAGTTFHDGVADFLGDGYRPYFLLLPYQYWGLSSLVIRFLAPMAVIVFILRERPRDWGFQFKGQWEHVRPYAWFLGAMLPVLFLASAMFRQPGPRCKHAGHYTEHG